MTYPVKAARSRLLVLALLATLIGYYSWLHLSSATDALLRIAISCLPLALCVPGLLRRQHRAASLLCFVLLLYFMLAVQWLFAPGNIWRDSLVTALIALLFTAAMLYSRWQHRADIFTLKNGNQHG
ncbi:MAG: DUF2069 domain-containing protein [Cellvibrionales bacterium]|nr:DUF2069 domain-containing protein [Cellvibrionales bacterium]